MNWVEQVESIVRSVGEITQDDVIVRGSLTVGAALITILAFGWRIMRRTRKGVEPLDRVKIDAPNNVRIYVDPVEDTIEDSRRKY